MRVAWSDDGSLEIAVRLFDVKQIDRLIRALQVNRLMLQEYPGGLEVQSESADDMRRSFDNDPGDTDP